MGKISIPQNRLINFIHGLDTELRLITLASIIGIVGGFGAIFFRFLIDRIIFIFFDFPGSLIGGQSPLIIVLAPTIGGLLTGSIVYFIAIEAKGHGVPEIIASVNINGGKMRHRIPLVKMIASAISIGSGGSAGREGPIAQIGGGFGSYIGQFFQLGEEDRKTLVISGVSAGISATFNTPIGGVLFGLEVIRRDKRSFNILPLIIASVVGTSIGEFFLGKNPAFQFPTNLNYQSITNVPFFILIGIIMGLVSVVWIVGFYWIESLFEKIKISPIILTGIGGLMVGIIELRYPEVKGATYGAIDDAFAMKLTLGLVITLFLIKFIATSITLGSGGSGGVFAPTLFLGVMVGSAIGLIITNLGYNSISIPVFALLGMAAMFAGTSRAPLTAIVMTAEMVSDYQLFVPLMFSVSLSWLISREILDDDIYIIKIKRKGVQFAEDSDILQQMNVSQIMTRDIITISPKDRLEHVIDLMKQTGHTGFPVENKGKVIGIITEHDVDLAIDSKDIKNWVVSEICSKDVISVVQDCPVSDAFLHMVEKNINRFPVIKSNNDYTLVGWITRSDVMRAYRIAKSETRKDDFETKLFEKIQSGDLKFPKNSGK